MKKRLLFIFLLLCTIGQANGFSQCANNLITNGDFETGMTDWWNWHDNNPDAYGFTMSDDAYAGDSSVAINVLVPSSDLTSFQGGEFNNRPMTIPVIAGVPYTASVAVKSSVADAMVSLWIKDENDGWFTLANEFFTVGTDWQVITMEFVSEMDRADIHLEMKAYTEGMEMPYTILFDEAAVCDNTPTDATCEDNLVSNPSFEEGLAEWWNWHGGTEEAFAFYASNDAYFGDSSAVLETLISSDMISTGAAEYNNRGMVIPVTAGQFYEINFAAKSSLPATNIQVWVKDEFDSWFTLYNTDMTITDDWAEYSTSFQADADREDIHIELKVFNENFEPYSVFFDEIAICPFNPTTATCEDNIVGNPGFEDGINDWGNWHGGDETDYAFSASTDAAVASGSALISVLKPTADLTGTGEFNSRPQVSPVVEGQNYKVSFMAKSSLSSAGVQAWVKDEFDGWTTIGNDEFTISNEWAEYSFIFTNETSRDDIHIELKVFTDGAAGAYDVWLDEVAICETDEEPGSGEEIPEVYDFGRLDTLTSCAANMVFAFTDADLDNDGIGWETWDGSDEEVLAEWVFDSVLPYEGANSIRIDVPENHSVAELHHRFADRFNLIEGEEYTLTLWARSNVPAGDTLQVYTRAVRDTDWKEPAHGNFMIVSNEWRNYSVTFIADEDFNNAFVEMKAQRWNADFTAAYTVWYDEIQLCGKTDVELTVGEEPGGIENLSSIGVRTKLAPNPASMNQPTQLYIDSDQHLENGNVKITNILGQTILEKQIDIQQGNQVIELDTERLTPGMYFVNINHKNRVEVLKLQVVHTVKFM